MGSEVMRAIARAEAATVIEDLPALDTSPVLDETDTGSPDDLSHYCRKDEIARAAVSGGLATALCGVKFQPVRDPERFPVCPRCKALLEQLGERNAN